MPSLIIVADDAPISLKVLKTMLGKLLPNDVILITQHPRLVIDIVTENDVKMIFTDLIFWDPTKTRQLQIQGLDLCSLIRQFELESMSPRIPIVAFSGDASKKSSAMSSGADYFLAKPILMEDLKRVLKAFDIF